MAWVWETPKGYASWGADMDYDASEGLYGGEAYATAPVDFGDRIPTFRSRSGLKRFKKLHCPPVSSGPVIDEVWKQIILRYVPSDRIQFYPVRLIARGEVCDDYFWVIPFDRVRCIDVEKSEITSKIEKPGITLIFGVKNYAHKPGCLGTMHLARDEQQLSHILISDALKEALSATGEDSMFVQPSDVMTIENFNERRKMAR